MSRLLVPVLYWIFVLNLKTVRFQAGRWVSTSALAGYAVGLRYNVNDFIGLVGEWNATHGVIRTI
jgi:hypothetical protein